MGTAVFRIVGEGLAVEADHLGVREAHQQVGMSVLYDFDGLGHALLSGPAAKGRAQRGPFRLGVGPEGGPAESVDHLAIGHQFGGVHPVERRAGHGTEGTDRLHDAPFSTGTSGGPGGFSRYTTARTTKDDT
ncbi:hypothetical protein jaqu_31000 [Jannaschia aquimarina]|uniref:Uncharacterized protein n=1 Tax=Jannaschia aquimarina TaxID=935700 RepID=A0A0D1CKC5_9RHOB|nr:hypothetical protein jaqu_31000 [Jannaschia aquimarina]